VLAYGAFNESHAFLASDLNRGMSVDASMNYNVLTLRPGF